MNAMNEMHETNERNKSKSYDSEFERGSPIQHSQKNCDLWAQLSFIEQCITFFFFWIEKETKKKFKKKQSFQLIESHENMII